MTNPISHIDADVSVTEWMPEEMARESRDGLRRLAFATATFAATLAAVWVLALLAGVVEWSPWSPLTSAPFFVPLGLLMWLVARARVFTHRQVALAGLASAVIVAGFSTFFHTGHQLSRFGHPPIFGPAALIISVLPLAMPMSVSTAVKTAMAATVAALAGLASAFVANGVPLSFLGLVEPTTTPLVCVVLAYVVARSVSHLQRQAATAVRLGSYELEVCLGRGGMGEVWRANHQLLKRPTAVKLIHRETLEDNRDQALSRFNREARATASLESPHTVRLFDFGVSREKVVYYAMELLDGVNLERLIKDDGPQPPSRVVSILAQACASLAEAHDKGLIHRDIKPANLMLCRVATEFDFVKVLDFGLVALRGPSEHDDRLTRSGALVGTLGFLAPELLMGETPDVQSDLYALGCVGYWLLTGQRLFSGRNAMAIINAHLDDEVTPPSRLAFDVPEDLERVILRCLARDPDDRPQSAVAMLNELEACACFGAWTQARARAWWTSHEPAQATDQQAAEARTIEHSPEGGGSHSETNRLVLPERGWATSESVDPL